MEENAVCLRVPVAMDGQPVAVLQAGPVLRGHPVRPAGRKRRRAADGRDLDSILRSLRGVDGAGLDDLELVLRLAAGHLADMLKAHMAREMSGSHPAIGKAMAAAEQRYRDPEFGWKEAAEAAGVAPAYFSNLFHRKTGMTFAAWLAELRLAKARELLETTAKRISESAYDCGFKSLAKFNRLFREIYGLNPSEFRARLRRSRPPAAKSRRAENRNG